jgi:hypothetical protein
MQMIYPTFLQPNMIMTRSYSNQSAAAIFILLLAAAAASALEQAPAPPSMNLRGFTLLSPDDEGPTPVDTGFAEQISSRPQAEAIANQLQAAANELQAAAEQISSRLQADAMAVAQAAVNELQAAVQREIQELQAAIDEIGRQAAQAQVETHG